MEKTEEKNKLTDKLKLFETEIHKSRIDLKAIDEKLQIAYQYEDDLILRMKFAKEETAKLKAEFFKKSSELSEWYIKMKQVFDVFTGNFYSGRDL